MDFFLQQELGMLRACASLNLWKWCFAFIVLVSYVAKVWIEMKHIFGEDLAVKIQNKIIVNKVIMCSTGNIPRTLSPALFIIRK